MRISRTVIIFVILVSLVLFVTGIYTYDFLFEWIRPKSENLKFSINSLGWPFRNMIVYSGMFALIPVSGLLMWKYAPVFSVGRRCINIAIVVFCVAISLIIKKIYLAFAYRYYYDDVKTLSGEKLIFNTPIEDLNFTNYMFLGIIVGSVCSYFLLKQSKDKII
ncbi:MAG: hypothetical protein HYR66_18595 [Sphingobacteriales bacterium]|nr:hypothetical protein [Sphingobacteriales bacterium]MBI3720564.1 hypothetical protein [Sphingobacteriales bacterium]